MDENTLISLAIEDASQNRYRMLLAKPKGRRKILDGLNHRPHLHPARTTWCRSFDDAVRQAKVPHDTPVYLLSATPEFDGQVMTFGEAIANVPVFGWGTIIGVSESLALYYGEHGDSVALIRRRTATGSGQNRPT